MDSNHGPSTYKIDALTGLSYMPFLVAEAGLEPATPTL